MNEKRRCYNFIIRNLTRSFVLGTDKTMVETNFTNVDKKSLWSSDKAHSKPKRNDRKIRLYDSARKYVVVFRKVKISGPKLSDITEIIDGIPTKCLRIRLT